MRGAARTTPRLAAYLQYMKIHFVGINGVSMHALSVMAESRGHEVTGSDKDISGHDAKNVQGCDLVVYTNAVNSDNVELVAAKKAGIPTVERAEYLGELSKTYGHTIAVAGCHGKSTATAMLGSVFAGRNATVHAGVAGGSRVGADKYFITEACEYRASFLHLSPTIGVVLNVQFDHPDYYRDEAQLVEAYKAFCARCKKVVVFGDDPVCRELTKSPVTFGLNEGNDYRAVDIENAGGMRMFTVTGKRKARVRLSVPGEHNVLNALAAFAAASELGLPQSEILPGIGRFTGIARRFERKGVAYGKTVFSDYAHHPTEIAATIKTAKEIFPSVAVVFQPHTYSRTASLMDDFVDALSLADTVVLAPVYSARESPMPGVDSAALCRKLVKIKERAYCFDTFCEILEVCKSLKEKAVIFTGAGDIDAAARLFVSSDLP